MVRARVSLAPPLQSIKIMSRLLHVTPRAPLSDRSELMLELSHVGGQLQACSKPESTQHFIEELVEIARQLYVPMDEARADSALFLAQPERIADATWDQCGGVLYALCQECKEDRLQLGARVAQRLVQLAPGHG